MGLRVVGLDTLLVIARQVYLPLVEHSANDGDNGDARDDPVTRCIRLLDKFIRLLSACAGCEPWPSDSGTHACIFESWHDEYDLYETEVVDSSFYLTQELATAQPEDYNVDILKNKLSHAHYKLKFLRIVHGPLTVFSSDGIPKGTDALLKALVGSLKAVLLQSGSKMAVSTSFVGTVTSRSNYLARWATWVLAPKDCNSWQGAVVCDAMQVWEVQWMQSNLEAVRILTDADFAVMFRSTRFVRNCVVTIQSLMKDAGALRESVQQVEDYFVRNRLLAMIHEELMLRIDKMDAKLLHADNEIKFLEFVLAHRNARATTEAHVTLTFKSSLTNSPSLSALKLLRRMQRTTGLTLFGNFITDNEEEQLRRMLTEFLVVRKGYDVTDYLEKDIAAKECFSDRIDVAKRLFERRVLFHRFKVSLLTIFPTESSWDQTTYTKQVKDQYIELARYLKLTEDKLHHGWFQRIQTRTNAAMTQHILRRINNGYLVTLHETFSVIWEETHIFLQLRFQVPQICHILLMLKPVLLNKSRALFTVLDHIANIVDKLEPHEFSVLSSSYAVLENHLILGCSHVSWSSLCLEGYIRELEESVDRFHFISQDITSISTSLKKAIATIVKHRPLRVDTVLGQQQTPIEFFGQLKSSAEEFFARVADTVRSFTSVMIQAESAVCGTQSAAAPQLQDYYFFWRQMIYKAIVDSLRKRFENMRQLLECGPALFSVDVTVDDQLRVTVDRLSVKNQMSQVVEHWINSASIVPYWEDGSCEVGTVEKTYCPFIRQEKSIVDIASAILVSAKDLEDRLAHQLHLWSPFTELARPDALLAAKKSGGCRVQEYDELVKNYRGYWKEQVGLMDDELGLCCIMLRQAKAKQCVLQLIERKVHDIGQVWIAETNQQLNKLYLLKESESEDDGYIDTEMLVTAIKESWYRLDMYSVQE